LKVKARPFRFSTLEECIQDCFFEMQAPEEIPLSEEDLDMLSLETQEQGLE